MKQKAPPNDEAFMRGKWVSSLAGPTRLELATSGLTGRRSNQLNYDPKLSSISGDFSR